MIALLQGLSALLDDEASSNPAFAAKLDALIRPPEKPSGASPKTSTKPKGIDVPDVHAELAARGDEDFRAWLCTQPADVLKAIIRRQDLDPSRRSSKWKDEKKLANFIADGLRARLSRGSAFIGRTLDPS